VINDPDNFSLTKGEIVHVDIMRYSTPVNFDLLDNRLTYSEKLLDNLERTGFYTVAEKQDLTNAQNLLKLARDKYVDGLYVKCHTDLREAYIGVVNTIKRLEEVYSDAVSSVSFLTVF